MARMFQSACYCTNARRLAGILSERYSQALAPIGLNVAQFCLLRNLERIGRGNITEWAEATGVERTTMVRNAKKLAEEALIAELPGRGKVYTLSEKGRTALQTALPLWLAMQKETEACLGPEDAEALLRIGKKIQNL